MFILILLWFVVNPAVMILGLTASQLMSAGCSSLDNMMPTPSVCGAPSPSCPAYSTICPDDSRSRPDCVHRVSLRPIAGKSCSSSSHVPHVPLSLTYTWFRCSRWQSWWLFWVTEVGSAWQFPHGFHCPASYALVWGPSSPESCFLADVDNVSVTDIFTDRVVSSMPTPLATGRGWSCLSGLYLLTCPAWVSPPGAEAPTSIALRVLKARKRPPPPPPRQGRTHGGEMCFAVRKFEIEPQ